MQWPIRDGSGGIHLIISLPCHSLVICCAFPSPTFTGSQRIIHTNGVVHRGQSPEYREGWRRANHGFGEAKGEYAAHVAALHPTFMVASLFPDSIQW